MASPLAASTARSYVLIGFIFYVIGAVGWILAFALTWYFLVPVAFGFGSRIFPFVFPLGLFVAVTIGLAWWSWLVLRRVEAGRYAEARTASLVLGVFGLFFGFLIGGIFFLLAYAKLGEILSPFPAAPMPGPLRVCLSCGRAVALDMKFCPHCGKALPA